MNNIIPLDDEEGNFNAFLYLKKANDLLSNPLQKKEGRELVIRALAQRNKFRNHESILKNLVRKSGLFPYLKSEFKEHTLEEEFLLDLYRTNQPNGFIFHSMQYKIYNLLMAGRNVVLSAPTSMGKSIIIDSLISSNEFRKIVLVVPTIALIDETRRRLASAFGEGYEIIHHNSQKAKGENIIFILTQERVNERADLENIDLFIIDEFYKLAFKRDDDERVVSLNIALSKLLLVSKQFYMIGPSIDNIRGLSKLNTDYYFIPSEFNTVALNIHEFNIGANDKQSKNKTLIEILKNYDGATIIYCRSPGSAGEVARQLIKHGMGQEVSSDYTEWIDDNYDPVWDYAEAIKNSIGIHHGALPSRPLK